MICVVIGRGRHRMMMAEHQHVVEMGAQLVELRLDYIRRSVDLKRLLKDRPGPVIITCRRPQDGGRWMKSENDRVMALRTAIADGADYVDLEWDVAHSIPRYRNTQRIISYHNLEETPDNLEEIHHRMLKLDPDIIKIVTMANNPLDNAKALRLVRNSPVPTVAFCMGEMGMPSRILCGKNGSPFTYAVFGDDSKIAPGMLTLKQLNDDYRYDSIDKDTVIFGVIGDPIAQSFSPRVHNACLRELHLNMLYLPFRVPTEYLESFLKTCPELGIRGLSVTIPHKEKTIKFLNVLDDQVAGIRAANTIVFKDVKLFGYNTDCSAAMESIESSLRSRGAEEADVFQDKKVLILGAGGVARAVAFGLMRAGAQVTLTSRNYRRADLLAADLKCQSIDWTGRANHPHQILVNCTPAGMHPHLDATPYEAEWFNRKAIIFDTVYNPEQTLFIKQAREAGCATITGVDMFVRQAARQFQLFTGREPNLETMRNEVKRAISAARY
jgi:3-dehydroquinate dehydratase / shikimate dehydrogenase